ncbi:MAG TPA: hypothetical protein VMB85_10530 [Bryobacteraceae bacterium]|nr:hypothetical protein [Bryobacteraceae bacterium]
MRRLAGIALATVAMALAACHSERKPQPKLAKIIWQQIGAWSGHGNVQTGSFDIGYEPCRLRWQARNESPQGSGFLRVTLHSAVSGRDLALLVDHRGAGQDTAYIRVDPHYSYLVIESKNLDWSVTVEEGDTFGPETK